MIWDEPPSFLGLKKKKSHEMSCKCSGIYDHGEGYVTAITDFWPPNVIEGSQNCNPEDAATLQR